MKRVLAILVLCCYMLCAFGITFSFHHCRGKLKYVNIHSEKKKTCCKSKKKMPKNCCNTVKIAFKKGDDNSQSFFSFKTKPADPVKGFILYQVPFQITTLGAQIAPRINPLLRPPPLRTGGLPLYIAHSVYRI
ncbi:HYC_CC_PP family protein [Polluticoccus soli]|uniref:HYC_CC_PP family protein n=1 Tax=Polluticoccus soli TaxID=3034150 RepID=UPI0023E2C8D0|nr:hypothetical protein [Flavipsychrobacter sp. JY13-12]